MMKLKFLIALFIGFFLAIKILMKYFSYIPSYNGDPFTEDGVMWSFNFFFHNKTLKRFFFFACRGLPKSQSIELSSEQLWGDGDD